MSAEEWEAPDAARAAFARLAARGLVGVERAEQLNDLAEFVRHVGSGDASVGYAQLCDQVPEALQTLDGFQCALTSWLADRE